MKFNLSQEDILDIKNCIVYHTMIQEGIFKNDNPLLHHTAVLPSFNKSKTHYKKLLTKIRKQEKEQKK